MSQVESTSNESGTRVRTHHVWVGSSQLFQTSLFFVPGLRELSSTGAIRLDVYDCDGALANGLDISFAQGRVGIVETESLLELCKAEGGFPHAHVMVRSDAPYQVIARLTTNDSASMLGIPQELSSSRGGFFPITVGDDRRSLLALVNSGEAEASVRVRLFVGNRVPEVTCVIPARGSRLLGVEGEFDEYIDTKSSEDTQAYLRLTTRSESPVYCNLIEQMTGVRNHGIFSSVC